MLHSSPCHRPFRAEAQLTGLGIALDGAKVLNGDPASDKVAQHGFEETHRHEATTPFGGAFDPPVQLDHADAVTLAADTYVKVGFKFNPRDTQGKLIRFFADGTELILTTEANDTLLSGANFPAGEELAMLLFVKNETTTAHSVEIDWWELASTIDP